MEFVSRDKLGECGIGVLDTEFEHEFGETEVDDDEAEVGAGDSNIEIEVIETLDRHDTFDDDVDDSEREVDVPSSSFVAFVSIGVARAVMTESSFEDKVIATSMVKLAPGN
jgi:hypothetical protein